MAEPLKPHTLNFSPSEIERADRVLKEMPEYENTRSRLIRQALREFLDRKERELSDREIVSTDTDMRAA